MRVMIVTTPIRPTPTPFPPFGALTLVKYLRQHGVDDVEFYNIDGNRPSYQEVLDYIRARKPDVLGISAVVSTAYEYSKRLSLDVKAMLPDTMIVLGGNMGASANVLLQRTGVDVCVVGEGENVFLNLVRRAGETKRPADFRDIAGVTYRGENGALVNTGYEPQLPADRLYDIDWDDLEKISDIDHFFPVAHDPMTANDHLRPDPRFHEPHRVGKRIATLYTSKGCVSRCTFCHRWDKGIRFIPVPLVMQRLDEVIERYNVGFLHTADENFGTDRRWLREFCAEIAKRDLLWWTGTRAAGMTAEIIDMMWDAGCSSVVFGNETGSERMLEIMEKKVSIDDNYNAVRFAIERGMGSRVQLVVGMPGESPETIAETIQFCKFTNSILPRQNPNDLSVNYAQALPGTPLYEFARSTGRIGKDLDGEEAYLLAISDRDAHDEYTTLNFTDYPKLICETWRPRITVEVNHHYVRKYGIDQYRKVLLADFAAFASAEWDTGYYANPKRLIENSGAARSDGDTGSEPARLDAAMPGLLRLLRSGQWGLALICYPVLAYHMRHFLILLTLVKNFRKGGWRLCRPMIGEYVSYQFLRLKTLGRSKKFAFEYKSLRRIVDRDIGALPGDEAAMAPLRKGR